MIQTVNLYEFRDAFQRMGRGNQFSYEALEVIYNYLEECDPDFELDVIAICCDFEELSPKEIAESYDVDISYCESDEEIEGEIVQFLENHTSIVGRTSDTIVFQSF